MITSSTFIVSANVIPKELVFFNYGNNRFMRTCDVSGFEGLALNLKKQSYAAVKKVMLLCSY